MDTAGALADLSEISSQIEAAVVFDSAGTVLGSTADDEARSKRLVRTALELVAAAADVGDEQRATLTQLEASLREGSVFVVTGDERGIAATTTPEPTSGLVFYDLKTCLRSLADEPREAAAEAAPRRRRRRPSPMRRLLALVVLVGGALLYFSRRRDERARARQPLLRRRLDGHARAGPARLGAPARAGARPRLR